MGGRAVPREVTSSRLWAGRAVVDPATFGEAMPHDESLEEKTQSFLREFFAKGESLVRDLIEENDRLRSQTREEVPPPVETNAEEGVIDQLVQRVGSLERELDEIRRLAGRVESQSGGYRDRLRSLEQEHYDLACMYVAGSQYQTATSIDEVLRTTIEILLNFIGVGRFTIFMVDEEREILFPVAREGGRVEEVLEAPIDDPIVAPAVALRRPWKSGDVEVRAEGELLTLPFFSGSRLLGLARLESFLQQKREFARSDQGLLALISERAGYGLETAWIRAHAREAPLRRDTVESLMPS
jgi:hypothetical protein